MVGNTSPLSSSPLSNSCSRMDLYVLSQIERFHPLYLLLDDPTVITVVTGETAVVGQRQAHGPVEETNDLTC